MVELIQQSGANTPTFINLSEDTVKLIDKGNTILLKADCERASTVCALTKLSNDKRRYYLSEVDICATMSSAQLNNQLAKTIVETAIENSLRTKAGDMRQIVERLAASLEKNEVLEIGTLALNPIAPYFRLNCVVSERTLNQLFYWLETQLAQSNSRLCILVKNIHHAMRSTVIERCLTIEKYTKRHSKFILCDHADAVPTNNELKYVFVPRASHKEVLSQLTAFVKHHQTKHNSKALKRIIELTQCHPIYLQKMSRMCLVHAVGVVSISQEWKKISKDAGNNNLGKLGMLHENAYKLLLGMRNEQFHKITSKAFVLSSQVQQGSIQKAYEQLAQAGLVAKQGKESYIKDPGLQSFLCLMS